MSTEAMFELVPIYEIKIKIRLLMYTETQLEVIQFMKLKESLDIGAQLQLIRINQMNNWISVV